jgi:hypothetical protein
LTTSRPSACSRTSTPIPVISSSRAAVRQPSAWHPDALRIGRVELPKTYPKCQGWPEQTPKPRRRWPKVRKPVPLPSSRHSSRQPRHRDCERSCGRPVEPSDSPKCIRAKTVAGNSQAFHECVVVQCQSQISQCPSHPHVVAGRFQRSLVNPTGHFRKQLGGLPAGKCPTRRTVAGLL